VRPAAVLLLVSQTSRDPQRLCVDRVPTVSKSIIVVPKNPPQPLKVTADALMSAIMAEDDFGLEMRVRSILEHTAGKVRHGWTYLDPVEEKPRQFDLRCVLKHFNFEKYMYMAVECKNLAPEAPLIISGTQRTYEESFHDFVHSDARPAAATGTYVCRSHVRNGIYPSSGFVGKSLLRLRPNAEEAKFVRTSAIESEIYNRWAQALASAHELCREALSDGDQKQLPACAVVLPAVVVPDGTLWTVEYDGEGSFGSGPVETPSTTFFVNHEVVVVPKNCWMNLSHVHFLTVRGLRDFVEDLRRPENSWEQWFPANAERYRPKVH
jgi:hypothetical protein